MQFKSSGGLGVHDMVIRRSALLAKHAGKIMGRDDSLWATSVNRCKYGLVASWPREAPLVLHTSLAGYSSCSGC